MFNKLFLASVLAVSSISSFAGTLSFDLYRNGNASSPKMDNVRLGKDIQSYTDKKGVVWVKANTGGISTNKILPKGEKNWWKLSKGTTYPSNLKPVKDAGNPNHYLWEPTKDMPLEQYKQALQSLNAKATKQ